MIEDLHFGESCAAEDQDETAQLGEDGDEDDNGSTDQEFYRFMSETFGQTDKDTNIETTMSEFTLPTSQYRQCRDPTEVKHFKSLSKPKDRKIKLKVNLKEVKERRRKQAVID